MAGKGQITRARRGRRREHPNQHCVQLLKHGKHSLPVANFRWKEADIAQLAVAHAHTSTSVTSGQYRFRSRDWSRDWRHFRWKGHTREDIVQLPVAHSQNILRTGPLPVTWLTSLPVTWLPVTPPYCTSGNDDFSVPIYY